MAETATEIVLEEVEDRRLKEQLRAVWNYQGYLSSGAVIGVFMMNYAREMLGCAFEDDIFVTVETHNCIPDAVTALAHCTMHNWE